jgi:hypothetical protein
MPTVNLRTQKLLITDVTTKPGCTQYHPDPVVEIYHKLIENKFLYRYQIDRQKRQYRDEESEKLMANLMLINWMIVISCNPVYMT